MADRPEAQEQGIEATPKMIEAGVIALWEKTTLIEFSHPADRLGVKIILDAALRVRIAN